MGFLKSLKTFSKGTSPFLSPCYSHFPSPKATYVHSFLHHFSMILCVHTSICRKKIYVFFKTTPNETLTQGIRKGWMLRKEISGYSTTTFDKQGWYQGEEQDRALASGTKFKHTKYSVIKIKNMVM